MHLLVAASNIRGLSLNSKYDSDQSASSDVNQDLGNP